MLKWIMIVFCVGVLSVGGWLVWNNYGAPITPQDAPIVPAPVVSNQCGIENCHGLEILCGPNPAEMCTMMYQLGDKCRQYAACGVIDGICQQIDNPQFIACKVCVERCESEFAGDPEGAFVCESRCE